MAIFVGLDLGTTNAKAAAYDINGNVVARAAVSYPTGFPGPRLAEQKPADWTAALTTALRQVVATLSEDERDIVALGVSAHGPTLILVDETGQPLTASVPIWQDERCASQGKRLVDVVGAGWVGLGMPLSGFPARLLWAIENQPDVTSKARYALDLKAFLVSWLTGVVVTEPSSGPGDADWWLPVFDALGWHKDRLAPVIDSNGIAGMVQPALLNTFGLSHTIPVVMGFNDGASAVLACGAAQPGDAIITLATNGVFRLTLPARLSPALRLDNGLFCYPYVENTWIAGGQTKCGAAALEWFAHLTSDATPADYERILDAAEQAPPGSDGVVFIPYLVGRGAPHADPDAAGVFTGLRLSSGRGGLARAVLEGVTFALRDIHDQFAALEFPAERILLCGGGAQSGVWRQVIADVFALPAVYYEADSALGAAIVAAIGVGAHANWGDAVAAMTQPLARAVPQMDHSLIYRQVYTTYQHVRDRLFSNDAVAHLSSIGVS